MGQRRNKNGPAGRTPGKPDASADAGVSKLSDNELMFCREYAIDHNATRAYLAIFQSCSYVAARANASRMLKRDEIKAEIAAVEDSYLRVAKITAKRVLRELANIAFFDPGDLFISDLSGQPMPRPWKSLSPNVRKIISSYKVKRKLIPSLDGDPYTVEDIDIRFHSKLDALDKLCKHLGLTNDGDALKKLLEALDTRSADSPVSPSGADPASGDSSNGLGAGRKVK